jgi:DNA-binding response OmpR family regulator
VHEQDSRALVVEEQADVRELLVEALGQAGFSVQATPSGRAGLELARKFSPDLVTLNMGLPDVDGVELCRELRAHSDAYVIMLSSRSEDIDRLDDEEIGVDDYLTTPFSMPELRARATAILRRQRRVQRAASPVEATSVRQLGELAVDVETRVATLAERELDLTRTEFDLLATLLSNPRRVWSRDALLREVWSTEWVGDGHLVEVHLGNLRRKLGDDSRSGRWIRTVRGVGYRLGTG